MATLLTATLGARNLIIASGILAAASMTGIAVAPNATVLGIAVGATGLCTGLVSPPLATVVAESVAQKYQNRVQTVVNSGSGVGVVISVPIALMAASQWRIAWLLFAVLAVGATIWISLSAPKRTPNSAPPFQIERRSFKARWLPRPLFPSGSARLLIASALLGASSTAMLTFGREFLVTIGEHSANVTTAAWVLLGATGLVGAAAGSLTSHFGLMTCWLFGSLSVSAASVMLVLAPHSAILGLLSMALFGAAYTTAAGFLLIWSTQVYYRSQSVGVGMAFLVIALGQAAATPALGLLMDHYGAAMPFYVAAGFSLAACAIKPRFSVTPITMLMEIIPLPPAPSHKSTEQAPCFTE